MSNTDGEDTQRIKAKQILTEAIGKDCVFSIDGKMWNVGNLNANTIVDSMLKYADQELASLREQLKQQEEVIRELIESIHALIKSGYCIHFSIRQAAESSILKAKSLTTKDK